MKRVLKSSDQFLDNKVKCLGTLAISTYLLLSIISGALSNFSFYSFSCIQIRLCPTEYFTYPSLYSIAIFSIGNDIIYGQQNF
jgi:hypothetical protein